MIPRLLTMLVAIPIISLCTYVGGWPFFALVASLALFSLNEFYNLMSKKGIKPSFFVGNAVTLFFMWFASFTLKHPHWEPYVIGILTAGIIVAFSSSIFVKKTENTIVDISITLLGILYVGWMFSYLTLVRELTPHGAYLFFLMIAIWANDIAAYLIGSKIGRIKLSPFISPKKTVEGAIAGFIVCIIAAGIFSQFIGMNLTHALILGVIVGIMGQVSDLVESLIKRDAGVKDSSSILPGHGGFLDRMDSFILTAPIMFYYISWFVG
ncbi:phosphatidate cytidylyltransferase [Candidatus Margulisiibacteriota bacterium]